MRVQHNWQAAHTSKSFTRSRVIIGGLSSVSIVVLATVGIAATQLTANEPSSNTRKSNNTVNTTAEATATVDASAPTAANPNDETTESFTQSADGSSQTRQYKSVSEDQNGNQTTSERTYTVSDDGSSSVDINISSNSTTNGSAHSSSSVQTNINSSTFQSSFTQN